MIERVVAFGCSFTYGHGLVDCYNEANKGAGPEPSKYSYPSILGDYLGVEVLNEGKSGCSNTYISNKVLNCDIKPTDFVIVQWTDPARYTISLKDGDVPIGPWTDTETGKQFYRLFDDNHLLHITKRAIHHIELYLQSKNIPFLFGANCDLSVDSKISTAIPNLKKLKVDVALDDMHPGPNSHRLIAHRLFKTIKEKYDTKN